MHDPVIFSLCVSFVTVPLIAHDKVGWIVAIGFDGLVRQLLYSRSFLKHVAYLHL